MSLSNLSFKTLFYINKKDSEGKLAEITSVDSIDMSGLQSPLLQQKSEMMNSAVAVKAGEARNRNSLSSNTAKKF